MKTPKERYEDWLDAKDRVNTGLVRLSGAKENEIYNATENLSSAIQNLIEQTRWIFEQDESRIKVRNETIAYLHDKIASMKDV